MVTPNVDTDLTRFPAPEEPDGFEVGTVLSSKYLIERRLGRGGMGTIYAAINLIVNRRVAIKVMRAVAAGTPDLVGRFRTEARAAATIGHPNIVDVLDMGHTEHGLPYVVMEYLEGEDLFERLARVGPLPAGEAVCLIRQVLEALEATHALGVIHCDLKPENVFLARRAGRCDIAKVLDFGAARFDDDNAVAEAWAWDDIVVGTPAYMSPEQAAGKHVDRRSDIYSVGVIMYEMLSGHVPFEGSEGEVLEAIQAGPPPPLSKVAPHVDPRLARIVDRAMAWDPADRPPTAAALSVALLPFGDDPDAASYPLPLVRRRSSGAPDPIRLPVRWHPLRWMAGIAALGGLALLAWRGPLEPYAERALADVASILVTPGAHLESSSLLPGPRSPRPAPRFSIAAAAGESRILTTEPLSEDADPITDIEALAAPPAPEEPVAEPVRRRQRRHARPTFRQGVLYGGPPLAPPVEDLDTPPLADPVSPRNAAPVEPLDEDEDPARAAPPTPAPFTGPLVPTTPDPPATRAPIPPSPYPQPAPPPSPYR